MGKILEISRKSREEFRIRLSVFNLIRYFVKKNKECSVEYLFRDSKVFEKGEPYQKNFNMSSRRKNSSDVIVK